MSRAKRGTKGQRRPAMTLTPRKEESLVDIDELCQFLKLGKTKVSELIHDEGLPYHPFGRAYRFDLAEVRQWMQERRASA